MPSFAAKLKVLLILEQNSWKTKIELFPSCAIWHENKSKSQIFCELLWEPPPRTPHPEPIGGTWHPDPYVGPGTREPPRHESLVTQDLGSHMWDPIRNTHSVYQSTVFCVVLLLIYSLEFSSQFLIIAKWFQIFQFWITWYWKFNLF